MLLNKKKQNLINLFIKTIGIIKKSDRKRFVFLIIFLILQALLDVVSIASIVPLLYLFENKENVVFRINEFFIKFGLSINYINYQKLTIYIPIIVILIMTIATIGRIFIVQKTNQFIEQTRFSISSRLMQKYLFNTETNKKLKSEVAKSILSEVDQFIIIIFQPVMWMVTNFILLIGIFLYLLYTNLNASIISIFFLSLFYIIFYLFTKNILNIQGIKSESSNKGRFKTAIEIFESIKDIKIYSAEKFFSKRFQIFSRDFANTNALYSTLIASPKYLLEMIVFIALSFTILILSINNSISLKTIPLLGTFAFAAYKAQPALSNVIYGINSLEYGSKIINNLSKELKYKKGSTNQKKINRFQSNKIKDDFCLITKALSYTYNKKEGISNLNLKINFPSLFVIAGESGSGKSTLLNLISGLQKPQKGEIIFNEKIFNNSPPKISYLHQDHTLFDASIAENIAFGIPKEEIDFKLIDEVLQLVGIMQYVKSLKNGLNTQVGEKGNKFSVGQKQRISIARALYFKPNILILDEPTSALDKENSQKLIKTLINISKNITVIISTHQLSYLPDNINIFYIDRV